MGRRYLEMMALKRCTSIGVLFAATFLLSSRCLAAGPAPSPREADPGAAHALFDFHSGFWINLHHFLYEEAAAGDTGPRPTAHEPESQDDASVVANLTPDEQRTWSAAVSYYRENVIQRDLLKNDALRIVKNRLEESEDASTLARVHIDPVLARVLDRAAPIYRAHWWPQHDRANRAWIDAVTPLIDQHGAALSQELAKAFETPWPSQPIRVDVIAYANWAGAYTTLLPSRVAISSVDSRNQQTAALEILFHEASHTLIENVGNTLLRDFAARKKTAPRDLWHALLFFSVGFYVQQLHSNYTPYADRNDLWEHGFSRSFREALVKDWQPRLEGKLSLDAALAKLAADFPDRNTAHIPKP